MLPTCMRVHLLAPGRRDVGESGIGTLPVGSRAFYVMIHGIMSNLSNTQARLLDFTVGVSTDDPDTSVIYLRTETYAATPLRDYVAATGGSARGMADFLDV